MRYTRQQILEKLEFWKRELEKLDESRSPLIDALVDEFGEDSVFGFNGKHLIPVTLDLIEKCYAAINKWMFSSKLKQLPIFIEEESEYSRTSKDHLASYSYTHRRTSPKYTLLTKKVVDENGKVHYPPRLKIPWFVLKSKMPLMFVASIIAHEMIHQYDVEIGDELVRMKEDDDKEIKHDPHGEVFKKFMKDANDLYGLSVELAVDLSHVADEFARSILAAREKIDEDGTNNDDGRIVVNDENLLIVDHGNGLRTVNMY